MKKLAVFYSNRAEKGILMPVIKRMRESSTLDPLVCDLFSIKPPVSKLGSTYDHTYKLLEENPVDLALCGFDRLEMIFVALAAHHHNIPIAQVHAGDQSFKGSFDDVTRHSISLYAQVHFCNGYKSYMRTCGLMNAVGRSAKWTFEVGSTAFDDLEIDDSLCPEKPYLLILYNPPTRRPDLMETELTEIKNMVDKPAVWIGPNWDPGSSKIVSYAHEVAFSKGKAITYRDNVPRPQFLGLLKNCDRFLGNSSSLFLEAPYFLPKERIIHIGVRNQGREFIEIRPGGSDRIVSILEELNLDELGKW